MIPIEAWRLIWDVDNKLGFIDLDPVGPAGSFRIGPLSAEEFSAAAAVLSAARAAGGKPAWDGVNRALIF